MRIGGREPLLGSPETTRRVRLRRSHLNAICSLLLGCIVGCSISSQLLHWLRYNSSCDNGLWEVARRTSRRIAQSLVSADAAAQSGLLFTGVMTAQKYIDTRAVAIYETWGQTSSGNLLFFSSEGTVSKQGLPLVALRNVDDSYPPQKKSFMMLKYMYENFLDKYEWFMRCDDDVYVHTERLELFLRSINSSKALLIGQAGLGNKAEHGQLNLGPNQNFCMGGPGIIMSRKTLSLIGPHIRYCLEHLYSTHEDVEVGRCVHKFAGIPCTWSYEMQSIFHNNFRGEIDAEAVSESVLQKAITLHPIKRPQQMYLMHKVFLQSKAAELRHQLLELDRDAALMLKLQGSECRLLNGEECPAIDNRLLEHPFKQYKPMSLEDVQVWDFFAKNYYSPASLNPRRRIESYNELAINRVVSDLMTMINRYSKQRGRVIEFRDIMYGYVRYTPGQGIDYVLDLLLSYRKFRGRRMSIPVRRHAYIRRSFAEPMVKVIEDSPAKKVHFIVPLAGRSEAFQRFLMTYEKNCVRKKHATALAVVYFENSEGGASMEGDPKQLLEEFRNKYREHDVRLVEASGQFSRAQALEIGAKLFPMDALLFFVDVDMIFDEGLVQRISWNTIQGNSVYFPIVFSQYDPEVVGPEGTIDDRHGYWRQFGFGIVSIFHSDLMMVGGLDTNIHGWGKEDVDLFDKVVHSNLTVFRAPDPGLVHVYHRITCAKNLSKEQSQMCEGTRLASTASRDQLADLVAEKFPNMLKN